MSKSTNSKLDKRNRTEKLFILKGYMAILISFAFLLFLIFTIAGKGISGLQQTQIKLEIEFNKAAIETGNYNLLIRQQLDSLFPEIEDRSSKRNLYRLVADPAKFILMDMVQDDTSLIGETKEIWLPADEKVDIFFKQNADDWDTKLNPEQKELIKTLESQGLIDLNFNFPFFTYGDSQEPELAGIAGALIGSMLTLIVCMAVAIPLAVCAAIYLEEFAPKNRFTDLIEVNINNLAALPSIVFGLLGLSVYLNFFGMPRSAPFVGGLTLGLMVIPVIIIATRAALKAVPSSIRQAAMGIGASPLQVVTHHTLPLAMPGIMTGTILSIARALGETAPLLMIGMVAFIVDVPQSFSDPSTVMPVQIYLWSKNSQPGFVEKTAAAIIVLLLILILLNIIAVWIRKKYERRW